MLILCGIDGTSRQLHLLDGDESAPRRTRSIRHAQRDRFGDALHQHIQRFGLRVTAAQFWHIGDEVAFVIPLDGDGERIGTLSHESNMRHEPQRLLRNISMNESCSANQPQSADAPPAARIDAGLPQHIRSDNGPEFIARQSGSGWRRLQ